MRFSSLDLPGDRFFGAAPASEYEAPEFQAAAEYRQFDLGIAFSRSLSKCSPRKAGGPKHPGLFSRRPECQRSGYGRVMKAGECEDCRPTRQGSRIMVAAFCFVEGISPPSVVAVPNGFNTFKPGGVLIFVE